MKRLISILGPTACGKTDLAIEIAAHFPVEIISVDSALIYRGMDIGTGKPAREQLAQVPHHLIDILDPSERYSVGKFLQDVEKIGPEIETRNKIPLFVGGTMMYFKALLYGFAQLPETDIALRDTLQQRLTTQGIETLYQELTEKDPIFAAHIAKTDTQRIIRGLELHTLTHQSMAHLWKSTHPLFQDVPHLVIMIAPHDRSELHQRIADRFHLMMQEGFLSEVEALFARGDLHADLPSIRSVGYRQLWQHFEAHRELSVCMDEAIAATRQLAKRQITWLKQFHGKNVIQVAMEKHLFENRISEMISDFLEHGAVEGSL